MTRIALQGVSKLFPGPVTAVEHLDLEVRDQELLVLVGPSGCGKTTILRMIAGLEQPTQGRIYLGQRVVNEVPARERNLAMVFQGQALYPHLSVYKNLAFGLELRYGGGWFARVGRRLVQPWKAGGLAAQRQSIRQQVEQTAHMLGLEHLLDRMPRQLSGGQRQRVALGRALVRHPAAFLLDEPLSGLDAQLRAEMRREWAQLQRRLRVTTVYVTHDQAEALALGERIVVMDRGQVQQIGTPQEVYQHPRNRFVAGFLGSPPINLTEGWLEPGHGRLCFRGDGLELVLPGSTRWWTGQGRRRVLLGVRPEQVVVQAQGSLPLTPLGWGRVAEVQWLGDVVLLYLQLADEAREEKNSGMYISKCSAPMGVKPGDLVRVWVDVSQVHWFDPASGENLEGQPCQSASCSGKPAEFDGR